MSFCVNCGNELDADAKFCPKCGTAVAGTEVSTAEVSTSVSSDTSVSDDEVSPKKKLVAFLTAILVGNVGVHDFYLGHIKRGVFKAVFTGIGYFFYFIGLMLSAASNRYETEIMIIAAALLIIACIFLIIPAIIQLVDWIKILCNKVTDKNGKKVINWT